MAIVYTVQYDQTGKYVVRAEDLPRASKLPCAQNLKNILENIPIHMGGDARTGSPCAQIFGGKISSARRKQTFKSRNTRPSCFESLNPIRSWD